MTSAELNASKTKCYALALLRINKLEHENSKLREDGARMDWLCKFTEFRFRVYDSKEKRFLRENFAQGVVIRPVIDAAMEKYPNP